MTGPDDREAISRMMGFTCCLLSFVFVCSVLSASVPPLSASVLELSVGELLLAGTNLALLTAVSII